MTYDQEFREFVKARKKAVSLCARYAREAVSIRGKPISIRMVWERVRWDHPELRGLNDHMHSRLARYLMSTEPALSGAFRTRMLRS